jgi:carboxymethylenebutenolidase
MISINTLLGSTNAYVAVPPGGTGPGLLVLHAWWGLNAFFVNLCDGLASAGFMALAPDLNAGQVATTIEAAERIMAGRDVDQTKAIALAAIDALRSQPGVQPGGLGALGFSMGAAWAIDLSALRPDDLAAVVLFYGTNSADFASARAAYQGHFAQDDEWESDEGVRQMKQALQAAGREADFYSYPGTRHWFFETDRPEFDSAASRLAWDRTLLFLRRHLPQPQA